MKRPYALVALMLTLVQANALAQVTPVPQLMNFQGRLAKPDGTPVPNGTYSVRFSLWTALTGGTEKWNQTVNPVAVRNGTFAVPLSTFPAGLFNADLFLEIKVGTDAPLTPRQPLASVAYAFKADSVKDGGVTTNSLANGAVTTAKIANGAITSAKLDPALQGALGGFGSDNNHLGLAGAVAMPDNPNLRRTLAVSGNRAYLALDNNTLQIVDLSNPRAPVLMGSAATDFTPWGIAVSGNFAYVINVNGPDSLQIFDVSNPAAPVSKSSIPAGTASSGPNAVAVSGAFAYVVSGSSDARLKVFNVSNPAAPVFKGAVATDDNPMSVAVSGGFAYVVSTSANSLKIYNVSNPAAPVFTGGVATGAFPVSVAVSGNFAYVLSGSGLQIFNVSNPAAPFFKGGSGTYGGPTDVSVSGNFAYVVCYASGVLQIFNVSKPATPAFIHAASTGAGPVAVASSGNSICVATSGGNGSLEVFSLNTLDINSNLFVTGGSFFQSSVSLDQASINDGSLGSGLTFGAASGEGIASKRTFGGNQWGLDFYTAFQNRMSIDNVGNVGIGTNDPIFKLDVIGDINAHGSVRSNGLALSSDARYKRNIAPIDDALDAILNLRGVTYDWNRDAWKDKNFPDGKQIGFIAQEVEKVLPELVQTDKNGYKSVAYVNVVPILVEAVKTLKTQKDTEVQALKTQNAQLQTKLDALLERMARLEKHVPLR